MIPRPWLALGLLMLLSPCGLSQDGQVKPVNLGKINTDADEEDPFALPDGLSLLFARMTNGNYAVYQSRRVAGSWGTGKAVIAEKKVDCRTPFVHKSFVYFAQSAVVDDMLADLRNFDLVRKIGETAPVPIPGISEKADELSPWITPGGKELYFSRKTDDGWTLFVAEGPTPGPIGKARPVGFPAGYHHATLMPNALVMYLQGPLDNGRVGIFRSKRSKVGGDWSDPEPITTLNHAEGKRGDLMPSLTADGSRLYFVSDRPGGMGGLDLWTITTVVLK